MKINFYNLRFLLILLFPVKNFATTYIGNLSLSNQAQVDSFHYDNVTGVLTIDGNGISNINALSTLDTVNELIIQNTSLSSFNGLQNLKLLSGSNFLIKNNALLTDISFLGNAISNKANTLYLEISNNTSLSDLTGLRNFFYSYAKAAELTLVIDNNSSLVSLSTLNPPKDSSYIFSITIKNNINLVDIDTVYSIIHNYFSIINNDKLTSININVLKVYIAYGEVTISDNDLLQNVTFYGQSLGNNYFGFQINNNPALKKITLSENGSINTHGTFSLNIYDNTLLDTITGFNQPALTTTSINLGNLNISNNPNLRFADILNYTFPATMGFSFSGAVTVQQNNKLSDVNFLHSVRHISGTLTIANNAMLSNCCGLYPVFAIGGVTGAINISGNPSACSNQSQILNTCSVTSTINVIKGRCYIDANNNQQYDNGEIVINNQKLQLVHQDIVSDTTLKILQDSGKYSFITDTGKYIISCLNNLSLFSVTPVTKTLQHNTFGNIDTTDFIFIPIGTVYDASLSFHKQCSSRSGFKNTYIIVIKNEGNQTYNGKVKFKPASFLHINSSIPAQSATIADTVVWDIVNLLPFQSTTIKISVTPDSTLLLNAVMKSVALVGTSSLETNLTDNKVTLNDTIRGSFDPNNKEVSDELLSPSDINNGKFLTYIINFQNTGNDTAFKVVLLDTLLSTLNYSSIEMIGSSHPCELVISKEKDLSFVFDNINLPDSSTNLEGSSGFVIFKIKPLSNLAAGDKINNYASIIFDNNLPVVTNTATTKIEFITSIKELSKNKIKIFPNPAQDKITIELPVSGKSKWILSDVTGKMCKQNVVPGNNVSFDINVNDLAPGIYILSIENNNTVLSGKILITR